MTKYYGVKNNANYVIKDDGTLWEVGKNRRDSSQLLKQLLPGTQWKELAVAGSGTDWAVAGAIKTDGTLWVWGGNQYGQLGLGDLTARSVPTQVGNLSTWSKVAFGGSTLAIPNMFAIKTDGTLWGCGLNNPNVLGTADTTDRYSLIQVGTASDWSKISCGYAFHAIKTNGTLWGWGRGYYGGIGNGGSSNVSTPVQIGVATNWSSVEDAVKCAIAIKSDGTLWGWGTNHHGMLGNNTTTSAFTSPVQISTLSGFTTAHCGYANVFAIRNGELWGAGITDNYALGFNGVGDTKSFVQIGTSSNWVKVSSVQTNGAAGGLVGIQTDGTLWASGFSGAPNGLSSGSVLSSITQVGSLSNWANIRVSWSTGLAINSSGALYTCGDGIPALGYYAKSFVSSFVQVGETSTWASFPVGSQNITWGAVIDSTGTLHTFGDNPDWISNYKAALPYGYTIYQDSVVADGKAISLPIPAATDVAQASFGGGFGVYVKTDGTVWGWGNTSYGQLTNASMPFPEKCVFNTQPVKQISSGAAHSIALNSNGTIWAQGYNGYGQLGNGIVDSSSPQRIGNQSNWSQVDAGYYHTAAVNSNGQLYVWGNNSLGQLGNNKSSQVTSPMNIASTLNTWSDLDGGDSVLAVKTDGTLWAWGINGQGVLGLSDTTTRSSPTQVGNLSNWSKISVGYYNAFSIKTDGTLWAWGSNFMGTLGISNNTDRYTPVQVGSMSNWAQVGPGNYQVGAVKTDGTLWTWGSNSYGQLGLSDQTHRYSPVQLGNSSNWAQVKSGELWMMGLKTDGTIWTWGYNLFGQLGQSNQTSYYSPVQVGIDTDWSTIDCGTAHASAIKTNGTLWFWGQGTFGQAGLNTSSSYYIPIQVGTATDWSTSACGDRNVMATKTDGSLWAWGNNTYGQLGTSNKVMYSSAVQVGYLTNWKKVFGCFNSSNLYAITSDGVLYAAGKGASGQLCQVDLSDRSSPVQIGWYAPSNNWSLVSAGQNHTYGINSGGTVWGWGSNSYGQLANNNVMVSSTPVQVGAQAVSWSSISINYNSVMAVRTDGTLWGWGGNNLGQLGLGTTTTRSSPTQIGGSSNWAKVSSANDASSVVYYTTALKTDGTIWATGGNTFGCSGLNTNVGSGSVFAQIGASNAWTDILAQSLNASGVQSDGTLWTWGNNSYGQLGTSDFVHRSTPVKVGTSSNWSKAANVGSTAYAIKTDGTLWAWGGSTITGTGTQGLNTSTVFYSPVQIGDKTWTKIVSDIYCTYGIQSNGTLWAWGTNAYGQLGVGDLTSRSSPVQVGADTWNSVATQGGAVIATKTDGTLWYWGNNQRGQATLGDSLDRSTPVQLGTLSNWIDAAVGYGGIKALNSDRTLYSAGKSETGQMGFNFLYSVSAPLMKIGSNGYLDNVSFINSGVNHSLAIKSDGTVYAWGNNSFGQLGLGDQFHRTQYDQMGVSNGWTDISGGYTHSAGINNGYLYAWGNNSFGQLGVNNQINYSSPVLVGMNDSWKEVFLGGYTGTETGFYIQTDGTLWSVGSNKDGQLGTSSAALSSNFSPVQVGTQSNWSKVVCSQAVLALKADGTLWGWGNNQSGQLGLSDTTNRYSPVQIGTSSNWTDVSSGGYSALEFTLALKTDGTLWGWGKNGYYQLGLSVGVSGFSVPQQIGTASNWSQISAGGTHAAAIKTDGTLWIWGDDGYGQLGLGDLTSRSYPNQVGTSSNWSQVQCGTRQTVALKNDGTMWAWGNNSYGALGISDFAGRSSPTQIGTLSNWAKIAGNSQMGTYAALNSNGKLYVWGIVPGLSVTAPVNLVPNMTFTNAKVFYSGGGLGPNIAGFVGSQVYWITGYDNGGILNLNKNSSYFIQANTTLSPSKVGYGLYNDWSQVTCGYNATIGLRSNGTLWSCGSNTFSVLGQPDLVNNYVPTQIGNLSNWSAISTNAWQSLFAINSDGAMYSWGLNSNGQLGRIPATIYSHIQIGSKSNWTKVAAGTSHWLGIDSDNTLWAQGNNAFGQLGTSNLTHRSSPTQIGTLSDWSQIAAGDRFSAALKTDGTLWAWGNNSYGQLGQGDYTHRSSPVQVGTINTYYKLFTMSNTILAEIL